jgi:hypothetical protein
MALMHNDGMRMPARLLARLLALTVALTLTLAGCGDEGDDPDGEATGSPTESAEAEPYLPVPEGVDLTEQGSTLAVGDAATVAYEPRQDLVGALDITVTSLEKASFDQFVGWELTPEIKSTSPYFVRATVTNVGDSDLGGRPVPLYVVDGENRLIESSLFTGAFKPCEGASFPKKFKNGDTVKACMVYLAPGKGDLTAVSFRPTQDFNPIIWEGELTRAKGTGGGGSGGNKGGGKNDGGKKGDGKKNG